MTYQRLQAQFCYRSSYSQFWLVPLPHVQTLLQQKKHEEQAYRVCLGLLNLSRSYPTERVNKACAIANQNQLYRLKQIKAVLRSNQDALLTKEMKTQLILPQEHENIRGPASFH